MNLYSLIPLLPIFFKGNILENLKNFDEETIMPIANFIGLSDDATKGLISIIPALISGKLSLGEIISAVLPIAVEFFTNEKSSDSPLDNDESPQLFFQKLSPLENFADENIYLALNNSLSDN